MREQKKERRSWKQNLALVFCFVLLLLQLTPFGVFATWTQRDDYETQVGSEYYLADEVFEGTIEYTLSQGGKTIASWGDGKPLGSATIGIDENNFSITVNFDVPTYRQLYSDWMAAVVAEKTVEADELQAALEEFEYIQNGNVVVFPLVENLYLKDSLTGPIPATDEKGDSFNIGEFRFVNTSTGAAGNKILAVLIFNDGIKNVFGDDSEYVGVEAVFKADFQAANIDWGSGVKIGGEGVTVKKPEYTIAKTAADVNKVGSKYQIDWTVTIDSSPAGRNLSLDGYTFSDALVGQTYVAESFYVGSVKETPNTSVADTISYDFGPGDETEKVITFTTEVDGSTLETGVPVDGKSYWNFEVPNTAELKKGDSKVADDTEIAKIQVPMLDKTGERVGTGVPKGVEQVLWTITVNPNNYDLGDVDFIQDLLSDDLFPRYAVLVDSTASTIDATNITTVTIGNTGVIGTVEFKPKTVTPHEIESQSGADDWVTVAADNKITFDIGDALGAPAGSKTYTLYFLTATKDRTEGDVVLDAFHVANEAWLGTDTYDWAEVKAYDAAYTKGATNGDWIDNKFIMNMDSAKGYDGTVPTVKFRLSFDSKGQTMPSEVIMYDLLVHGAVGDPMSPWYSDFVQSWKVDAQHSSSGTYSIPLGTELRALPTNGTSWSQIMPSNYMRYAGGISVSGTMITYAVYKVNNEKGEYAADLVVVSSTESVPNYTVNFNAEITNPDFIVVNGIETSDNEEVTDLGGGVYNIGNWVYGIHDKQAGRLVSIRSKMFEKSAIKIAADFDWDTFAANPLTAETAKHDGSDVYNYLDNSAIFRLDANQNRVNLGGLINKVADATVTTVTITDILPTGWEFKTFEEMGVSTPAAAIDSTNLNAYFAVFANGTELANADFGTYFTSAEIAGPNLTLTLTDKGLKENLVIFYKAGPTAATLETYFAGMTGNGNLDNEAALTVNFKGGSSVTVPGEQTIANPFAVLSKLGEAFDGDRNLVTNGENVSEVKWTIDYMPRNDNSSAAIVGNRLVDEFPEAVLLVTTGDGSPSDPIKPVIADGATTFITLHKTELKPDGSYVDIPPAVSLMAVASDASPVEGNVSYNPDTRELSVILPDDSNTKPYRLVVWTPVLTTGDAKDFTNTAYLYHGEDYIEASDSVVVSSASASALMRTAGSFTVLKLNKSSNAKLPDVKFNLTTNFSSPMPNIVLQTATTNADGKLTFGALPEGSFLLVEDANPSGYAPLAPIPVIVSKEGGTYKITLDGKKQDTKTEFTVYNIPSDATYLTLTKRAIGIASTTDPFAFTVTLSHSSAFSVEYVHADGKTKETLNSSSSGTEHSVTVNVGLKNDDTVKFNSLPKGVAYSITEKGIGNHTVTVTVNGAAPLDPSNFTIVDKDATLGDEIASGKTDNVIFTNHIAGGGGGGGGGGGETTPTPEPTPTPTDDDGGDDDGGGGTTTTTPGETTTTPETTVPPEIPGGGGGTIVPYEKDNGEIIFVQLDEDGTPLGKWVQNEDGEWELVDLLEDEIPRGAFLPKTGSMIVTGIFAVGATMTAAGLVIGRKRKEEDEETEE